jgi:glucans biosynthesis protein
MKLGLAPLTSMYLTGENDRDVRDGFAPNCTIPTGS